MLFALIGILTSLLSVALGTAGSIVGLLLNTLIVYYLTRPHVKVFFGKGPAPESARSTNDLILLESRYVIYEFA